MLVKVKEITALGKEKSFLNKEGERVSSMIVRIAWTMGEEEHQAIAIMGTKACDELHRMRKTGDVVAGADIRFEVSTSRNNKCYFFTTCYVTGLSSLAEKS